MDGWRLDRWNWQGITPFYSQSQQKAEAHSSQLYVFSNKLELERGSEGDKARGEKQSNASMPLSLSLYFSRFSLVNWILSGVVGRAPVQPRFFYTNQPLHLIHANHRPRSWCRHTHAPHLSQARRPGAAVAEAPFVSVSRVAHTIPEKRILHVWSTKRSLFVKPFHEWV